MTDPRPSPDRAYLPLGFEAVDLSDSDNLHAAASLFGHDHIDMLSSTLRALVGLHAIEHARGRGAGSVDHDRILWDVERASTILHRARSGVWN